MLEWMRDFQFHIRFGAIECNSVVRKRKKKMKEIKTKRKSTGREWGIVELGARLGGLNTWNCGILENGLPSQLLFS